MDKFKSVAKGGWHPEKERTTSGSSAGGQSDSKIGQVKGWVGKAQGKDPHAEAAREHQSTPLSSLKDPASFAPPPKRLDYNAGSSAAASARSPTGLVSAPATGAKQRLQEREEARRRAEEEANKPAPGPYRSNTTGLSTAHLPKPPAFRPSAASAASPAPPPKPKPSLPPRLPPRQNSYPDEFTPPPPPTYNEATQQGTPAQGVMNQAALGRLGQAGVAVTGLGIGRTASPPVPPRANPSPPVPLRAKPSPPVPPRQNSGLSVSSQETLTTNQGSQMSELQSRFARLSGPKSPAEPPTTGTSWAEKQAALRTASNLRNDPSKMSTSDLKGAASTANNFQQRHGEQVASGWKSANSLNQKYGIAAKVNNLASSSTSPPQPAPAVQSPVASSQGGLGKKAPPPPPPKKKDLSGGSNEPPPIPLSSKPKF